jgi:hypothetical protein
MRPARRLAGVAATVALVTGGLAGCSEAETQGEAESAVCQSITELRESVAGLREVDADTTGEEAKAAVEEVRESLGQVRAETQDLQAADETALDSAVDAVADNVAQIDDSDTLGGAADALRAASAPLEAVVDQVADGLSCP